MIYLLLLLLLFTIAQGRGLFSAGQNGPEGTRRIGWLFALSSAANVAWLLLWHYELVEVSAVAVIIVAALITMAVLATHRDVGYGLVVLWALVGIVLKRSSDSSAASRMVFVAAAAIIASAVRSALRPLKA